MNLILLERAEVGEGGRVTLRDERAAHMRDVLELARGDSVRVGIVNGPLGLARVDQVDGLSVSMACEFSGEAPARPRVDLLLALPRPKVMKRLWAQLAALGVGRIILANAWKVEKNYFDTHVLNPDFYRPRLIEGLQQAGDTILPEVTIHRRFKKLVEDELDAMCPSGARLVAHPGGPPLPPAAVAQAPRVLLAVGPEGGWTDYEIGLLAAHGFTMTGMGPRKLRTDTACIALLALVNDAMKS